MKFDKFGMCVFTPMPDVLQYITFALPAYWCQFANPRIACNRRNGNFNNLQEGFTVVYEKHNYLNNPQSFDIAGVTCFYDYATNFPNPNPIVTFTENNYTDGLSEFFLSQSQQFLPDINSNANLNPFFIINHNPVVSYERKSGSTNPNDLQIMCIAFVHHLSSTQNIVASFYAHNSNGRPFTRDVGFTPNYNFYRVSTAINDNTDAISVSGELSEKFMYSFANETQFTICHKEVLSFEHLKHGHFVGNNTGLPISSEMLYDNFTPMFFNEIAGDVAWIDIQGKLLCNNVADLSATKERIEPGISFLSFLNRDGLSQKVKLIKL
ncbi:MAG: hypothetical protein IPO27_15055 [Bacteroidetes bacterium]|nr:hypothetical protein [Bacteroidota bacterium]